MNILKKYSLLSLKFLTFFLLGIFLLSILYYFFLSSKVTNIIGFIYLIILFIIFGFKEEVKSNTKGIITGFKTAIVLILTLFIFNLILFSSSFKLIRILYYLILLVSCILGAIIGANTKKNNE
jgi:hypothetical protein